MDPFLLRTGVLLLPQQRHSKFRQIPHVFQNRASTKPALSVIVVATARLAREDRPMAATIRPFARSAQAGQPPYLHPPYASTIKRSPRRPPIRLEETLTEVTGPVFAGGWAGADATDLTRRREGEPIGERMILVGHVLDEDARPVPGTLVELWQCNAAGRYRHPVDQHDAPLDPNFDGVGQVVSDERGEFRFLTIKPGAYPWRNTPNAWRPAHIHFGVFGPAFATRLITQMYFPGDPLLLHDAIYNGVADRAARERLICAYDPALSEAEWALGYRFDIVLRGRMATPLEAA
jgi:protocatechuate 3,4-dioxygenase, beta subunit